jgi:hypothetical protein
MTEEAKGILIGFAWSALFWVVVIGAVAMSLQRACGQ